MDEVVELLKELSEALGVSGYESDVRVIVHRLLAPLGTVEQDRSGSVLCSRGSSGPRVMMAAHMDEIGFMVHHVTPEGFLKFHPLGGWWDQVLLGQRVTVQTRKGPVLGVIGAKPPHLLQAEERLKTVEKKDMYVDIGAVCGKEAEQAGVRPGDPVVPASRFEVMANGKSYVCKAFDDRVGLALIVQTLRHFSRNPHPNRLIGVGTVMEEVGLRGAKTSVELAKPDVALIADLSLCGDVPGIKPEESSVKLGGGPTLYLLDAQMIPNLRLRDLVVDTAEELGIPLQFQALTVGATDGGPIHLHGTGVPTAVLGVPSRHVHTHANMIHRDDYDRTLRLLLALIGKLDAQTVAGL
jgi:putative aminopeptidase FrvX